MDPAEPYFQNMDEVVRLDPSDALFVDVIHSDAGSFYSTELGNDVIICSDGLVNPAGRVRQVIEFAIGICFFKKFLLTSSAKVALDGQEQKHCLLYGSYVLSRPFNKAWMFRTGYSDLYSQLNTYSVNTC